MCCPRFVIVSVCVYLCAPNERLEQLTCGMCVKHSVCVYKRVCGVDNFGKVVCCAQTSGDATHVRCVACVYASFPPADDEPRRADDAQVHKFD